MNIGVARPTEKELQTVPHHFMASHSVNEEVTAVGFEQYALEKIEFLFKKNNVVVLVGGTGLYIKAFEDGLDLIPEINVNIRREIVTNYENLGINWLQQELREKDPVFFKEGEIQNPQRMMRALEVINATGQSILSFRKGKKANRDFKIIKIGLELPKEILHLRIQERVDKMMEQGLLDEVKNMIPYRKRNALQTVGYAELFDYLEGKTELKLAVELIKTHTRQYAKRQMTWFKKDKNIQWFGPNELNAMLTYVKPIL